MIKLMPQQIKFISKFPRMSPPLIETSRLIIRPYAAGDEQEVFHLLEKNRDLLRPYLPAWVYEIRKPEEMGSFIKKMKMGWLLRNYMAAGIWLRAGNKLAGEVLFFNAKWEVPEFELGYYLAKDLQGQGIINEALNPWLSFGFGALQAKRIVLTTALNNIGSRKVAEQAGFTPVEQSGASHETLWYELSEAHFKNPAL
jgi:RimJ/RimL family protein N-acetyltransferase